MEWNSCRKPNIWHLEPNLWSKEKFALEEKFDLEDKFKAKDYTRSSRLRFETKLLPVASSEEIVFDWLKT